MNARRYARPHRRHRRRLRCYRCAPDLLLSPAPPTWTSAQPLCPLLLVAPTIPARALRPDERQAVRKLLYSPRFQDASPAAIQVTLLDEGQYLCSTRTMYRILDADGATRKRRDQRVHPFFQKPELLATTPNQLSSWDITKLRGPVKWTYFCLYVILRRL